MGKNKDELIRELLTRQVERIYPSSDVLEKALKQGKSLTIYWGIDPTGPSVHIAHATNIFVLRRFQKLGHRVIILIGDFTAQIGDPTGKDKTRLPLTEAQVKKNLKNYQKIIFKILDPKKTVFKTNSQWWNKMTAKELLNLDDLITHQQLVEREMFQRRIRNGLPISMKEMQYPIIQGYDSVALKTDIEIGGKDQMFNMLVGRDLEKTFLKKEKIVITTPLLDNPKTGEKIMSKSTGHYIAMDDEPREMYGKVMALPDDSVPACFDLCVDLLQSELEKIKKEFTNPSERRNLKAKLAFEVVKTFWNEKSAREAQENFDKIFKCREVPENIFEVRLPGKEFSAVDLLIVAGLAKSKSEARRLVIQKSFKVDSKLVDNPNGVIRVAPGMILQVGKRRFVKMK